MRREYQDMPQCTLPGRCAAICPRGRPAAAYQWGDPPALEDTGWNNYVQREEAVLAEER